jgi:hypothetical protein
MLSIVDLALRALRGASIRFNALVTALAWPVSGTRLASHLSRSPSSRESLLERAPERMTLEVPDSLGAHGAKYSSGARNG